MVPLTLLSRPECTFDGCSRKHKAKGYCSGHYRHLKEGRPLKPLRVRNLWLSCTFDGCENPSRTRRLCGAHYAQFLRGEELRAVRAHQPGLTQQLCSLDGCDRVSRRQSQLGPLCQAHHKQHQAGRPLALLRNRPGGSIRNGYRDIYVDGTIVPEHRFVMEQMLQRALAPGENVHHKNGDKLDNRPDNLELWYRSQPSGQRISDLIAYIAQNHRDQMIEALSLS